MLEIEIDGKILEANPNEMLIEVADRNGIVIPRFCYHKKLSVSANCRMCLVEVEKSPKPLPACATPVSSGMKVFTKSTKTLMAQKGVMEFLLINHPLDCPICDQGGECELQDVAMGFGKDISRFTEGKRSVDDIPVGSLIHTDMTKCIHCTRCVRFGTEIAGMRELGLIGRGEKTEISTFIEKSISSEVSGNVIDLCPVGALTSEPYRYTGRSWEMTQHGTISPHDSLGSNIYLHVRNNKVMRVVPKENEAINEIWISDRDRFSYEACNSENRIKHPMIKKDGKWENTSWEIALKAASEALLFTKNTYGAHQIGFLYSSSATLEETWLLKKLANEIGTGNLDHRTRQLSGFEITEHFNPIGLNIKLNDLESCDHILVVGSNVHKEIPVLGLKLRKAALGDTKFSVINPIKFDINFSVENYVLGTNGGLVVPLLAVCDLLLKGNKKIARPEWYKTLIEIHKSNIKKFNTTDEVKHIAELIKNCSMQMIMLGTLATQHREYSELIAIAAFIGKNFNCKLAIIPEGANAFGAWQLGAVPQKIANHYGLNAYEQLHHGLRSYLLFGIDPVFDSYNSITARKSLKAAESVIAINSFFSDTLLDTATIILPKCNFAENAGSYINIEGQLQDFNPAIENAFEAKLGWKILRVLGNFLRFNNFEYTNINEVREELHRFLDIRYTADISLHVPQHNLKDSSEIYSFEHIWIGVPCMHAIDETLRHAPALQNTPDAKGCIEEDTNNIYAYINSKMADNYSFKTNDLIKVTSGKKCILLPVMVSDRIPCNVVYIPTTHPKTISLGAPYNKVSLEKVEA